jgi:hypothetical protein
MTFRRNTDQAGLSPTPVRTKRRGPHEQNEDTELAWAVLTEETENILQLAS